MYNILKMEFEFGWLDANGLKPYVGYGSITQDQLNEIVGVTSQSSVTPASTQPASQAPSASSQPAQSIAPAASTQPVSSQAAQSVAPTQTVSSATN